MNQGQGCAANHNPGSLTHTHCDTHRCAFSDSQLKVAGVCYRVLAMQLELLGDWTRWFKVDIAMLTENRSIRANSGNRT